MMSEETAAEVNEMMQNVVNEGPEPRRRSPASRSPARPAPRSPAARLRRPNQAWFIGFAPADDPQIAVAATVECTTGFGGEVAAPIAGGDGGGPGGGSELRMAEVAENRSSTTATGCSPARLGRDGGRVAAPRTPSCSAGSR